MILFSKNYTYKLDKCGKLSGMATQTPFWKLKTEDGRVASHLLPFYLDKFVFQQALLNQHNAFFRQNKFLPNFSPTCQQAHYYPQRT